MAAKNYYECRPGLYHGLYHRPGRGVGMAGDDENRGTLKEAISVLNQITTNPSTPKTIRKNITDLVADLGSEEYRLAVRAANAISALDDITQDPNMPSFIRVSLWQAVSKLEGIRE
ncbi:uncharacterized protein conserved in archaea [Cenarchaeum symbiosum A]|uniref:UPF0147 protein CENSYa_1620 n=1 Tax=Cenarchaeum symbiosum (strain A) TaxID=414004 RepID=A0RY22_CENSY|nr:uncharacterized protein conserved in archaea [Cenarchaeum symbiosum A]